MSQVRIILPLSTRTQRGMFPLAKSASLWLLAFSVTHPLQHTHPGMLKYPLSFSHNSLFGFSVFISEGILHPSNSPPGSFILRLGPAHIPCQRLSILLNIKSSVSRLALSSPCSAPCIFRSRRPCYKAD